MADEEAAAISAAIDSSTPAVDTTPTVEPAAPENTADSTQVPDDGMVDITDPVEGAGEPEQDAENAEEAVEDAEEEAEEELTPEEAQARKLENALDAPVSQELSKKTQDRIHTLINSTRDAVEQRDAVKKDLDVITNALQNSGTTPQMFREFVEFRANLSSGDINRQKSALGDLVKMVTALADELGESVNFENPVMRHPDLVAEVQANRLPLARAEEIARLRNKQAAQARIQQTAQPQQADPRVAEAAEKQARSDLTKLGERLARVDSNYEAKSQQVISVMKQTFGNKLENLPHAQWTRTFERMYRALPVPVAKQAASGHNVPANQPMRHGARPAGNVRAAPSKNLQDWVNAGIEQASQRQ